MSGRADGLNDIFDNNVTIEKQINTNSGTIAKTPTEDLEIVNKKYVDDEITAIPADTGKLDIDGGNADQDIDIGAYDLTSTGDISTGELLISEPVGTTDCEMVFRAGNNWHFISKGYDGTGYPFNINFNRTVTKADFSISWTGAKQFVLSPTGEVTIGSISTDENLLNFKAFNNWRFKADAYDYGNEEYDFGIDFNRNVKCGQFYISKLGTKNLILDENGNFNIPNGAISSDTATITSSADDTDVSGVNTLFVTTAGGNVVIGGFSGGIAGQVLYIARKDATNDLTLEHLEGAGDQDIYMHEGTDETLDSWGGFVLVCDGSDWYDLSHAKHV